VRSGSGEARAGMDKDDPDRRGPIGELGTSNLLLRRPVRVLYFIGDMGTGGAEAHLSQLLVRLDRERIEPTLLLLHYAGKRLGELERAGIPTKSIHPGLDRGSLPRAFVRTWSVVRKERPDVLHAYGFLCNLIAASYPPPRGGTLVLTSRRGSEPQLRRRALLGLSSWFADRIVCVSEATRDHVVRTEGIPRRRCVVVPNGVDLMEFQALERSPAPVRRIGTLGRLRYVKGSDLLIEAFLRLSRPDLSLFLAGPADRAWGRELVARFANAPGVHFVGDVEAAPFLRTLDLFVLPSRSEGMSNALLEAMASGLPIVATDVGSNREVLDDGRAGILVRPDAGSIADGIRTLVDRPELAVHMGAMARRRAETCYAIERMVLRYEQLYESLVQSRSSARGCVR